MDKVQDKDKDQEEETMKKNKESFDRSENECGKVPVHI